MRTVLDKRDTATVKHDSIGFGLSYPATHPLSVYQRDSPIGKLRDGVWVGGLCLLSFVAAGLPLLKLELRPPSLCFLTVRTRHTGACRPNGLQVLPCVSATAMWMHMYLFIVHQTRAVCFHGARISSSGSDVSKNLLRREPFSAVQGRG